MINDTAYKDKIISLIQDEFLDHRESGADKSLGENTDDILKEIFGKGAIDRKEQCRRLDSGRVTRRILLKISVAAVILVVLALGITYRWQGRNKKTLPGGRVREEKTAVTRPISPATNAAVLTLANGKQIVLDSSTTGVIAQQGSAKMINVAGKLDLLNSDEVKPDFVYNNTLNTHRANVYQITLSDGTKVWLNALSSITFPNVFAQDERRVSITGEAYFEVAKNPLKPFIVDINGIAVRVLGTHFNVDAYDRNNVSTTLLEGSVQVSAGQNKTLIKPGEAAEVSSSDITVHKVNLDKAVAWKNHEFYFEKDSLGGIMQQLGRWYDVDIQFEGKYPGKNSRYSGSISRNAKLSDALLMLHQISKAEFNIQGRTVIVKSEK